MLIENNLLRNGINEIYDKELEVELKELYLVKLPKMIDAKNAITFEQYKSKVLGYKKQTYQQEASFMSKKQVEKQVENSNNILSNFKPKLKGGGKSGG